MNPVRLFAILLVTLLFACAPAGNEPPAAADADGEAPAGTPADEVTHGGPIEDYVSLVDALRFAGATVKPAEGIEQPFFEPQAQVVEVNGEAVQIFEFADEEAATAAADTASGDGSSVGTSMLSWVDTPHFYQVNRLILLYVGSDQETLSLLQEVLGEPFAAG